MIEHFMIIHGRVYPCFVGEPCSNIIKIPNSRVSRLVILLQASGSIDQLPLHIDCLYQLRTTLLLPSSLQVRGFVSGDFTVHKAGSTGKTSVVSETKALLVQVVGRQIYDSSHLSSQLILRLPQL